MGRRVQATPTWPREAPDVSVSVNGDYMKMLPLLLN